LRTSFGKRCVLLPVPLLSRLALTLPLLSQGSNESIGEIIQANKTEAASQYGAPYGAASVRGGEGAPYGAPSLAGSLQALNLYNQQGTLGSIYGGVGGHNGGAPSFSHPPNPSRRASNTSYFAANALANQGPINPDDAPMRPYSQQAFSVQGGGGGSPRAMSPAPSMAFQQQQQVAPSGVPSDEGIVADVRAVLASADLTTVTKKGIRTYLEQSYGAPLSPQQKALVNQVISTTLGLE
jgi:chitin synthase